MHLYFAEGTFLVPSSLIFSMTHHIAGVGGGRVSNGACVARPDFTRAARHPADQQQNTHLGPTLKYGGLMLWARRPGAAWNVGLNTSQHLCVLCSEWSTPSYLNNIDIHKIIKNFNTKNTHLKYS